MLAGKSEEAEKALAEIDENTSTVFSFHSVKELIKDSMFALSGVSVFHWYYLGLSLTVVNLILLSKVMYPLYEHRVLRTVSFHGLLLGFLITLLARFLPSFLSQFGRKAIPVELKLPSDYSVEEIDSLLLNCGKNIHILELAGFLHFAQGNFERAREMYQTALSIDPHNQNCTYELGRCFEKMGKLETACEHLIEASEMNPDSGTGQKARWWASLLEKKLDVESSAVKALPEE